MESVMDGGGSNQTEPCDDEEQTAKKAEFFTQRYQGQSPWDIGRPQPALAALEAEGLIRGAVLDVGCGTGENALFFAGHAHETWGVDIVADAIDAARDKARKRGLKAEFRVLSALKLDSLGRTFETVVDSGLFHSFGDDERVCFVSRLAMVLQPGGRYVMLCRSDRDTDWDGPRRISRQELYDSFGDGWKVSEIRPARFVSRPAPDGSDNFAAWLVVVERL